LSDEFVYKGLPSSNLGQSYDETMVIEETVEMEIECEPQTLDINDQQVTNTFGVAFLVCRSVLPSFLY